MSIQKIHLRKLLNLFYLSERELISALRGDIRHDIYQDSHPSQQKSGGDFHSPFWSDVKSYLHGEIDLKKQTQKRMSLNPRRRRLYPLLQNGFLNWWNEKRRWSNQEYKFLQESIKGQMVFQNHELTVKVENLLSLDIGENTKRLIYPYFSESPRLSNEAARIGLWVMSRALKGTNPEEMRILDVLRGEAFSLSGYPLQGNEENLFLQNYEYILGLRQKLLKDYR